tara:strand:- start:177 stop:551 length:375 start_codon:yes stop_codon:yes gene_type:complete
MARAATKVKPSVTEKKVTLATTVTIPAPVKTTRGRVAQSFAYTGKEAGETRPQTPQFIAMICGIQDMEDKSFDKKNFDLLSLVRLCVKEGHLAMPHTKNPEKQMRRIVACYKQRLIDEEYITLV